MVEQEDVKIDYVLNYEKRFTELWKRMDGDMRLYYMEKFVLKDSKGKKLPEGVASSITLNDARTFADRAVSILGTATRHLNITGIDPTDQVNLEKELKLISVVNDDALALQGIEPLDFCDNYFAGHRGWIGQRVLMLHDGDKWMPEFLPLDPRWLSGEADRDGPIWGCHTQRMTAKQIKNEYDFDAPSEKDVDIKCLWTRKTFSIYQATEKAGGGAPVVQEPKPHGLGLCPIIRVPVPTQPLLISVAGEDALKHQGEGFYAANRDLYDAMNEQVSIAATLAKMQFMSPLALIGKGRTLEQMPFGIAAVVSLEENEQLVEIPTKELGETAQFLVGQLLARLQRGGLPFVDYGELGFELSALAIAKLTESRDQVFIPRLRAKASAHRRLYQMVRKQILANGFNTTISEHALDAMEIDKAMFEPKFQIAVAFHAISPEQNVANITVAQGAKALGISMKTILKDYLKHEDPEGEMRQAELENAHHEIETLRLFDYLVAQGTGDITEEEKNQTRAAIIEEHLDKVRAQTVAQQEGAPAQPASQAKLGVTLPEIASKHIVEENAKRSGVESRKAGERARTSQPAR